MENYSTFTNANDADFSLAGAVPGGNTSAAASGPATLTGAGPVAAGGAEDRSIDPAVAPATASNTPVHTAASTGSVGSHSQRPVAKEALRVKCIEEPVRTVENNLSSWKPPFEVEQGFEGSLKAIIQRADTVRDPLQATPVPTGSARYGTAAELFGRLQEAIAEQALVQEQTSALLTYWTMSTWLADALPIAPGLSIVAPEFEGDLVLRALRSFCRYPMMLTRADIPSLKKLNWQSTPTVLFYDPNISKQMVTTLGCTSTRGYLINDGGGYKDFFGPKALYLGADVSVDRIPRCSLQVRLQPTAPVPANSLRLSEAVAKDLQNQLLRYRCKNLVRVYNSDFDASLLTSDMRAIANALGACIFESPGLQSKLISLLTPLENQRQADLSTSLEAITVEATLNLAHAGKTQTLVNEIANEVNRIVLSRGERLHYSAETIGHRLKKIGLITRRLGKAGKGLFMDLATMKQAHELAAGYGGAGLEQDENNLHCPLCTDNK
jgi:hypothetical protein